MFQIIFIQFMNSEQLGNELFFHISNLQTFITKYNSKRKILHIN